MTASAPNKRLEFLDIGFVGVVLFLHLKGLNSKFSELVVLQSYVKLSSFILI